MKKWSIDIFFSSFYLHYALYPVFPDKGVLYFAPGQDIFFLSSLSALSLRVIVSGNLRRLICILQHLIFITKENLAKFNLDDLEAFKKTAAAMGALLNTNPKPPAPDWSPQL